MKHLLILQCVFLHNVVTSYSYKKGVFLWNIEAELLYRSTHLPVKECQLDYGSVAFKFTQNNAILPFKIDDSLDIAYSLQQLAR